MTIEVFPNQLKELLRDILPSGVVPYVSSSPGIGKSAIAKQIANEYNLELIDFRMAQADLTEFLGFPSVNKETKRSTYNPPDIFPLERDPLPEGKDGWLLLFDEFPSAPIDIQACAYKVILDRIIGMTPLHHNVAIMAAGNLSTDNAIVNDMSTAMQSRMVHLTLKASLPDFLDWAIYADIDFRIIAFIKFRPDLLHNFDPDHSDKTFACPRTYELLSKIIKPISHITASKLPLLTGTIGTHAGHEFKGFVDIMNSLPSIDEILNNPETVKFSKEPSVLYAISALIATHFTEKTASQLMVLINRLPMEFQAFLLKDLFKKNTNLSKIKEVDDWIDANYMHIT